MRHRPSIQRTSPRVRPSVRSGPAALLLATSLVAGATESSHAAALYLDVNGSAGGSGVLPATTYTWDVTSANWSTDPAGGAATQAWDPGATAVFSAGADAAGNVLVVVRGAQSAGGIAVEEGSVTLNSVSSASISLNDGTIDVAAGRSLTVKPVVAGTTFTKSGPGTLALVGVNNTFTGGFAVTGGAVQYAGENVTSGSFPSRTGASPASFVPDYVRLDGGAIQDTDTSLNSVLLNANKGIYLGAAGGTIDIADPSTTSAHAYAGVISGPGTLTKAGPGVLLLTTQASTYAGATAVTQGTLRVGSANLLPTATALSVSAGATFDPTSHDQTVGALIGTGRVVNVGRLTVAPHADTTWSGTIAGTGGLTCAGPAFVVLATPQAYAGPTVIAGTAAAPFGLRLGTAGAIPAATDVQFDAASAAAAPTLDLNGFDLTVTGLANLRPGVGHPTVTNTAATLAALTLTAPATPVDVTIAGRVSLVKAGASTLTMAAAANTYSGPTRVTGGTLAFSDPAQLGDGGPGNGIVLDGGTLRTNAPVDTTRTLTLGPAGGTIDTHGFDATISGDAGGPGVLTKAGAGTLTLGPTSLAGLVVSAGQVRLEPGAGTSKLGTLTVAPGCLFDAADNRLVLTGVSPSGVAGLLSTGRFDATAGDGQALTGMASSAAANDLTESTTVGYATAAQLGVTAWGSVAGLSATDVLTKYTYYGDLNLDGKLDADDYAHIDRSLAKGVPAGSAVWIDGDVNYDRAVDAADYLLMDHAYALHGGALSPALLAERETRFGRQYVTYLLTSVPEPATLPSVAALTLLLTSALRPRP